MQDMHYALTAPSLLPGRCAGAMERAGWPPGVGRAVRAAVAQHGLLGGAGAAAPGQVGAWVVWRTGADALLGQGGMRAVGLTVG